jgi:hypothetical protein
MIRTQHNIYRKCEINDMGRTHKNQMGNKMAFIFQQIITEYILCATHNVLGAENTMLSQTKIFQAGKGENFPGEKKVNDVAQKTSRICKGQGTNVYRLFRVLKEIQNTCNM